MNLKRLFAFAATIASMALSSALVIPPAEANGTGPSLPTAGDHLFAMASSGEGKGLGSIDVSTGAALGLATNRILTPYPGDSLTGAAFNPTTGTAYVINEISNHKLQSVNSSTGALTTIAKMWLGAPSAYKYVRSIAISDSGAAYAIVDNHFLYSLNLVTAEVTFIGDTGRTDLPSLAFNPIDDLLYAVDGTNGVFTINTATGSATQVGENSASMCGFQIDRAGVAWYKVCGGDLFSSTNLTTIDATAHDHGPVTIDGLSSSIWAILYVPAASSLPHPSVPRALAAGTSTTTGVPLSWTVPLDLAGGTVTDYRIQYRVTGAASWSTFSDGVSTTAAATVTGLTAATSYQFHVSAVTTIGNSEYSSAVTKSTLALSKITSVPRNLAAGVATTSSVALAWTVPASLNGGVITDYVVQYRKTGTSKWLTFSHTASATRARKVAGLTAGKSYQFKVAARTTSGNSPYTGVVSKTTKSR